MELKMDKEQFQEFLNSPGMRVVRLALRMEVEAVKDRWAAGEFLRDDIGQAEVLGRIASYESVIGLEWDDVKEVCDVK